MKLSELFVYMEESHVGRSNRMQLLLLYLSDFEYCSSGNLY